MSRRPQSGPVLTDIEQQPSFNQQAMLKYSKWPWLADKIQEPNKLRNYIDAMRYEATRRDSSQAAQFTGEAMRAREALKEIWGIDYDTPNFVTPGSPPKQYAP